MSSIISFTFREAVADVEYKGKNKEDKTSFSSNHLNYVYIQSIKWCIALGNCHRIPYPKRLEGYAFVQEYSSQP